MMRLIVFGSLFAMLVGTGCRNSAAPASNKSLASSLDLLKEGLDAWKNGSTPSALESGANAIHFNDGDWNAGAKLLEYRVVKSDGEEDLAVEWDVALKLEIRGKSAEKIVSYSVTNTPKRTISRITK